jgi:hypothetical protein
VERPLQTVRRGETRSCGCDKKSRTHGMTHFSTFKSWQSMKDRCENSSNIGYARYGGRGIAVCARWQSFENFLADMGERPAGTTIDRIDNDGNYEPGNCRWATQVEQSNNRSSSRLLTHKGETMTVAEWAERTGMKHATILHRLNRGWSVSDALDKPARSYAQLG